MAVIFYNHRFKKEIFVVFSLLEKVNTMEKVTNNPMEVVLGSIGIVIFFLQAIIITLVLSCRDLRTNHSILLLLHLSVRHMVTPDC